MNLNFVMNIKRIFFGFIFLCAGLSEIVCASETLKTIPLPYDYEVEWKCTNAKVSQKTCDQFSYYVLDGIKDKLHDTLLRVAKALKLGPFPEDTSYAFLGDLKSARVLIAQDFSDNVATYAVFTLINDQLVDHRVIGVDDMEASSVTLDFMIDKSYRIFVYSRKPNSGIKSPRKLVGMYQIQPDGKIVALK